MLDLQYNILPNKNTDFTGRAEVLREIKNAFTQNNKYAITGAGGFGKTQIALKYAYDNLCNYDYILWVNAENPEKDYKKFMLRIDCEEAKNATDDELLELIKKWRLQNEKWLFIYDNAEMLEKEKLQRHLPQETVQGHTLICTREANFDVNIKEYKLDVFSKDEALKYIKKIFNDKNKLNQYNEADAAQLAERLGYMPLALSLATAYIINDGATISEYINMLETHGIKFLDDNCNETDYKKAITATLKISMEKIETEEAKQLLNLCAYFAPDEIPFMIFIDGRYRLPNPLKDVLASKDVREYRKLIKELTKYNLMTSDIMESYLTSLDKMTSDILLSTHRLIQETIMDKFDDNELFSNCAEMAFYAFFCEYYVQSPLVKFNLTVSQVMHIANLGCLKFSEDIEIAKTIGEMYNIAGGGYLKNGNYSQSFECHKKALKIREKIFGKEHRDTADVYSSIAYLYSEKGEYDKALEWYEKVLVAYEKTIGKEHYYTALACNAIALVYENKGDYDKALEWYKKKLVIFSKVVYSDIASSHTLLRDYDKALEWYEKALVIRKKLLGKEHPDTAETYNNIEEVYRKKGDCNYALEWYLKQYKILLPKLGESHPCTITIFHSIKECYNDVNLNNPHPQPFEEWLSENM